MTSNNNAVRDHLYGCSTGAKRTWNTMQPSTASDPSTAARYAPGLPYSPWQLIEHIRMAQHDILDFCVNTSYREKKWPDDYWPSYPAPPSDAAWDESVASYVRDRDALKRLARDPQIDLTAKIPHGNGQTYLREILLVADHTSYHVGQLVLVRRLLGIWPAA